MNDPSVPGNDRELDRFFELSVDLLCIAGVDGRFKRINAAFETVLGYSRDELLSRPFFDFVHPDDREATVAELVNLRRGGTTIHFENRYLCKDGSVRWLAWSASPATSDGLIYAIARDITRTKEAEEALRRSEAMRKEFVATVSHELRTPLTSIHGSLGLLASGVMGELTGEAARVVNVAERNSVRLVGVINDILEHEKVDDGQAGRVLRVPGRSTMKVLIIDDEEDVRYVAHLSLGRVGGMNVIEASSGEEGIARAKAEQPDFILLDMMMPGMDGAETFHALRACPETASIPIVFLTAKSMASEAERLTRIGARGIITKPFNPMTLARELTAILQP